MLSRQAIHRLVTISRHVQLTSQRCSSSLLPVKLKISKTRALVDEKVQIQVSKLSDGQKITLQAYMTEGDKQFGACGQYIADQTGCVDTYKDVSYGGTFEGLEPMGLFWSMKTTPGVKQGRLIKGDVMSPYNVTIAVHDGFKEFDSLPWSDSSSSLASCHLERYYAAPGVQRFPLAENGLYGTLLTPPGDGPFPAIIHFFGLGGGILEFRAALLASHGFATLAVGYVGLPGLPRNELELDFNYFLKIFDWLAQHPKVDNKNIGGVGTCVGSGYLQFITSMRPAMKCIATVNTPGMLIGTEQIVEGELIQAGKFKFDRITKVNDQISFRNMFSANEEIPVCPSWRHGAKMLAIQGLDDQCVNPALVEKFKEKIPPEFINNFTFIAYPGAGHLIEPPYAPRCGTSYNKIFKMNMLWGGSDKQHSQAQEDAWPKILQFFNQHLQK
ncbi:bile acid-CoA:amino acid N-acyltransferase-like [Biomphalaria glabrata]|uniref:Bile acid-CoA:amino acid N-acyltransferase-like n=1 Tax=Biomphalaria glabrata TaxID=6526 RepID=A0A9U8EPH5_BIOGL|nr:bile acid-CoA:amino acid N-acyltransferase-like [Biomphalaria glabrata]